MSGLKELRNRTDSKKILVIGGGGNQNGSVSSSLEILECGLLKDNDFEEIGTNAFLTLENIGLTLLKAIAIYLNLEEDYFTNKVKGGESIMRSIHYYPLKAEDVEDGAVRAAAHGDINLITLLMGASADGLEILTKEEKWIPIISEPDQLVINVGDMLERLTNKKLMSTVHRVVNPSKEKLNTSRYSIPFFMHPKPDMDLTCLDLSLIHI